MGQIIVNGTVMGETNADIQIVPMYNEGIKIMDIIINGETTPIYIPVQNSQNGGNNS